METSQQSGISLVMPMAGRGSRFAKDGILDPKPLIDLAGKPFFWWAVESIRRVVNIRSMIFVVLTEHCREFAIDKRIHAEYPDARIVTIDDVTSGAAETARIGVDHVSVPGPIAVNDCDHAFDCPDLSDLEAIMRREADLALLTFMSSKPNYSYVLLDADGRPTGTIEKVAASPHAITGCYIFSSAALFLKSYAEYEKNCPYDELFISGMYNLKSATPLRIHKFDAEKQWSFGTPEELRIVDQVELRDAFRLDR